MEQYFSGTYYKHQRGENTLGIIVGETKEEKFIQIITDGFSMKVPFEKGNYFSKKGIFLNINAQNFHLKGKIIYRNLTPISYDIMGPFRYLPMECSHGIVSMSHYLEGSVFLNGTEIDFTGGKGYIERDCGRSFPSSYAWIQANDFLNHTSIMAAVAKISIFGITKNGCICVIHYRGKEYRLATYLGVRVVVCTEREMILVQGKKKLLIRIYAKNRQNLSAPQEGKMSRLIKEAVSVPAEFVFFERGELIFRVRSNHASFEFEQNTHEILWK
jgi:tocopherol cyclase